MPARRLNPFGDAVDVALVGEAGRRRRRACSVDCMPREILSERMKVIVAPAGPKCTGRRCKDDCRPRRPGCRTSKCRERDESSLRWLWRDKSGNGGLNKTQSEAPAATAGGVDPDQCNPVRPGQSFRHGATGKQRDSGARLPGDGGRDRHGSSLQPRRFGKGSAGQAAVALPLLPANSLVLFFRCAIAPRRRARADQRSCQWRLMCYRTLPVAIVREKLGT